MARECRGGEQGDKTQYDKFQQVKQCLPTALRFELHNLIVNLTLFWNQFVVDATQMLLRYGRASLIGLSHIPPPTPSPP